MFISNLLNVNNCSDNHFWAFAFGNEQRDCSELFSEQIWLRCGVGFEGVMEVVMPLQLKAGVGKVQSKGA